MSTTPIKFLTNFYKEIIQMGMFSNLKRTNDIEESKDTLGGGNYILESGVYPATVITAYTDYFKSGAQFINVKFEVAKPDGSTQNFSERFTITNKAGNIYYVGKDSKKHVLPGYEIMDDLCLLTTGKFLAEQETEAKVLQIWNAAQGSESPTEVDCLTALFGKKVLLAIQKVRKNKQVLGADNKYIDSKDEVNLNQTRKVFDAEYRTTVPEMRTAERNNVAPEAQFIDKWLQKNENVTLDEYHEVVTPNTAGFSGSTGSANTSAQTRVFGRRAG